MSNDLGFAPERLTRIDSFLSEAYIRPGHLPGAIVEVARFGEPVHSACLGMADVERGAPLRTDTIFRIYSMTKPITSVAFMILVEEGKVALDDPVAKHIPEWKNLRVFEAGTAKTGFKTRPCDRPMLIVDLMRHTSGLTYGFQYRSSVDAEYRARKLGEIVKAGTLDSFIAALAELPLDFSPGTAFNYSVSTDVLGYLVGKLSGMPFETFLAKRIFEPLGMTDTGFHVPPDKAHRLAACYEATPEGKMRLQDDPAASPFLSPPAFVSGGGGLVSTAADYMKFAYALLGGGSANGQRLIGRKTLELMTANHLPGGRSIADMSVSMFSEATYDGVGFGLGFATTTDCPRTLIPGSNGDFFWGGLAGTFFWIDPAEDLIGLFMTQLMPSSAYPVRRQLRTMIYAALDD